MDVKFDDPLPAFPAGATGAHVFSVDLEEHFQVSAFERLVPVAAWDALPSRVAGSTERLLDLLARHGHRATFFCVGWLTRAHGALLRRIVEAGHEVASHSYWHRRVTTLDPGSFREDARRAKASLEDATGQEVTGYRAPTFSIPPGTEWALEILVEEGHRYDSSLFPIRRPGYGHPRAHVAPFVIHTSSGPLLELPPAVFRLGGARLPAAGGAYLRLFPPALVTGAVRQAAAEGRSAMLYVHPWELDPDQPRLPVGALTRIRHYRGLDRVEERLRRLFVAHAFTSVRERYPTTAGCPA